MTYTEQWTNSPGKLGKLARGARQTGKDSLGVENHYKHAGACHNYFFEN